MADTDNTTSGNDDAKIFVGNLSFRTREADLAHAFEEAGTVKSANIITRGPRSLGYGFVEMGSADEANKAVQLLNKKQVDGREITVESAKPRDPNAQAATRRPANPDGAKPKRTRQRRNRRPQGEGSPATGGDKPASNNGAASPAGDQADGAEGGKRFAGRRRPRRNNNNKKKGPPAAGAATGDAPAPRAARPPRRDTSQRAPSTTTLFVANLPFAVDDAGLQDIFKDLKVTKAHIVRKRNNRSKGFGFVEFANANDQQEALAKMDKFSVEGRELIVKVALTDPEGTPAPAASN
jgi:RNA recognition motif-containing protein